MKPTAEYEKLEYLYLLTRKKGVKHSGSEIDDVSPQTAPVSEVSADGDLIAVAMHYTLYYALLDALEESGLTAVMLHLQALTMSQIERVELTIYKKPETITTRKGETR